jgi:unsaturated rhamnogalacturonyl hydrolase
MLRLLLILLIGLLLLQSETGYSETAAAPATPLEWAAKACDTMMDQYYPEQLPPAGRWHYHQGVFLLGMERLRQKTGDARYLKYIQGYVDNLISPSGALVYQETLDDRMPALLLFPLMEATKDPRYKIALDTLLARLRKWPSTSEGGFWHKDTYPNQMWLDGLWMAQPLAVKYAKTFNEPALYDQAVRQALLMQKHLQDPKTGLLYHGWDESRKSAWANQETGRSPEFWGRAIGWYGMALIDILEYLPEQHSGRPALLAALRSLSDALVKYQDPKTGLWHQVVDKGGRMDNWLETSCSCMYVYTLAQAVERKYLPDSYLEAARKGYRGVLEYKVRINANKAKQPLIIKDICVGTGVGDGYLFYAARPRVENDLHGVGAFVMMCVAMDGKIAAK